MRNLLIVFCLCIGSAARAQDSAVRIVNTVPYITHNIDSVFVYKFEINRPSAGYYWRLDSGPAGLSIDREMGVLRYHAPKNYFLSGRLSYDTPYRVKITVQSQDNPDDQADTSFRIVFYNSEIIPSRVKPTVSSPVTIEEGQTLRFSLQCQTGTLPINGILFSSSVPLTGATTVTRCGDEFVWKPPFDFVSPNDSAKARVVVLSFTGISRAKTEDAVTIRVIVRDALDYGFAKTEHDKVTADVRHYVLQLKYAFLVIDKKLKRTRSTRTAFDLTSAGSALTGTILNTSSSDRTRKTGQILPSVGLALVPVKEASAPQRNVEQNQASMIRASIKRLEYLVSDQALVGERDPDVQRKTQQLRTEMKQVQMQLLDVPIDFNTGMSAEELDQYFNSPKVNKKYRLKKG